MAIPTFGALFCIPVYFYGVLNRDRYEQIVRPGALLIVLIVFSLLLYIIALLIGRVILEVVWHKIITTLLVILWTSTALKFASSSTSIVRAEGHENAWKKMERGCGLLFLNMNLTTAALLYKFSYDPANTRKMWWTDYFG